MMVEKVKVPCLCAKDVAFKEVLSKGRTVLSGSCQDCGTVVVVNVLFIDPLLCQASKEVGRVKTDQAPPHPEVPQGQR